MGEPDPGQLRPCRCGGKVGIEHDRLESVAIASQHDVSGSTRDTKCGGHSNQHSVSYVVPVSAVDVASEVVEVAKDERHAEPH